MAISASDTFKAAMKAPVKVLDVRITTDDETPQVLSASDSVASMVVEMSGSYFGSSMSTATVTLIGTSYNLLNNRLKLELGVQTDAANNIIEYIAYGSFAVTEQEVDLEKEMTTVKCQNWMGTAANQTYLADDLTFPCTVAEMTEQIANKLGFTIATDLTQLPNYDYTITEDLYAKISNTTYRDILAEVAGATATIAAGTPATRLTIFLAAIAFLCIVRSFRLWLVRSRRSPRAG